jgi:uncharacterized repeat protein (TIGR01451 family)
VKSADWVCLLSCLIAVATLASAQTITGPFAPVNGWWRNPNLGGATGVTVAGTVIRIDRDGDGSTETEYPIPVGGPNFVLSPTREFLLTYGDVCSGGQMARFYHVPPASNPPGSLTFVSGQCISNGINAGLTGFYDTGLCIEGPIGLDCSGGVLGVSPLRIACVVGLAGLNQRLQVYWFDLLSGEVRTTGSGFDAALQSTRFPVSRYGDVAFVQHAVGGPPNSNYTLVELCPDRLGQPLSSAVGGALFNLPNPQATAEMMGTAGSNFVRVTHASLSGGSDDFLFSPCNQSPPAATGACCIATGTCSVETAADCVALGGSWLGPATTCADCVFFGACCLTSTCLPSLTQAQCAGIGGQWMGAGSGCSSCPLFDLDISKVGPASAVQGDVVTYTLNYSNLGDVAATNVSITDTLPVGSAFVSASSGGTFSPGTRVVTWTLSGPLNPGAAGSVTLTVRAPCLASIVNSIYAIRGNSVTFSGSPAVVTTLAAPPTAPITLTIVSVPDRDPLWRGDLVTHTLTLTNTAAEFRPGTTFAVSSGAESGLDTVLDAGGGAITTLSNTLTWTKSMSPNEIATVVFRTRVNNCATPNGAWLNDGQPVTVLDSCAAAIGSAIAPGPLAILQPTSSTMMALPPIPPSQPPSGLTSHLTQMARPGQTIDVQIVLTNHLPQAQAGVAISLPIRMPFVPVGDPPFTPPTDAAAAYDNSTQTISWVGTVAAQGEIRITFQVVVPPAGECFSQLSLNGFTGACADLGATLAVLPMPELPTDPHLIGMYPQGSTNNFWTHRPGIDVGSVPLLCLPADYQSTLIERRNGEFWVATHPLTRFNPRTLVIESLPDDFVAETLGIVPFGLLSEVLVDPTDDSLLCVGSGQGPGIQHTQIRRFVPETGIVTSVFDGAAASPPIDSASRGIVDLSGRIILIASDLSGSRQLVRIDPASPLNPTLLPTPGVVPASLALDTDGDYIVSSFRSGAILRSLVEVNAVSGTVTTLVPNLDAFVPSSIDFTSSAVDGDGNVYLSYDRTSGVGASAVVARTPVISVQTWPVSSAVDLLARSPIGCPGDLNGDLRVDLQDLATLLSNFGSSAATPEQGDIDGDQDVDLSDLAVLLTQFGATC